MRHRKHHGSLGLPSGHRRAVLANLATALLTHGRIETTQAKARAVRPYVEKLITLSKRGDVHSRRQVLAKLHHRSVVDHLFSEVAPVFSGRNGGYTRTIKTGFRAGDAAPMAIIELVQEEVKPKTRKNKPPVSQPVAAKPAADQTEVVEDAAEASEAVEIKSDPDTPKEDKAD